MSGGLLWIFVHQLRMIVWWAGRWDQSLRCFKMRPLTPESLGYCNFFGDLFNLFHGGVCHHHHHHNSNTGVVATQTFFGIFTPKFGEDEPILTNIFQRGWNHQLEQQQQQQEEDEEEQQQQQFPQKNPVTKSKHLPFHIPWYSLLLPEGSVNFYAFCGTSMRMLVWRWLSLKAPQEEDTFKRRQQRQWRWSSVSTYSTYPVPLTI